MFEGLEARQLLSVSMDSGGWTVVTPQSGDRLVYVSSSSGNNANSGLSASSPVKTLAKGVSLMRNGTGDELLLKAGDTWHENLVYWRLSGQSSQNPMLISSYGSGARPTIMSGTSDGLTTGASSNPEIDYLDIIGLHFWADGRDPNLTRSPAGNAYTTGINILSKSNSILVENCLVQDYAVNLNFQDYQGPLTNISVRRNVSIDSYSTNNRSQGLYANGVTNLLLEGNLFDHNGYNDQVSGAFATWFNHDCYISGENYNCVIRDNIFSRAAGYGLQARSGGVVQNNLFINNPVGASYGLVNGALTHPYGVTGSVTGNVFIGGANIGATQGGSGLQLANTSTAGVTVANNIFTHSVANSPAAITLTFGQGQSNSYQSVGINNLTIRNNVVYNYNRAVQVDSGFTPGGSSLTSINNVNIYSNEFKNIGTPVISHDDRISSQEHWGSNYFDSVGAPRVGGVLQAAEPRTTLSFASPDRTIESYSAAIGASASVSSFLYWARLQAHQNWNPNLDASAAVAYFQKGFGISAQAPAATPAPVSSSGSSTSTAKGSISGYYFYDSNANGVWNSGEQISPLWYLYLDLNRDGRYDSGDIKIRANSNGLYSFSGLAAGTYYIRSTSFSNWRQTTPAGGGDQIVTLKAGQNVTGVNFGVVKIG